MSIARALAVLGAGLGGMSAGERQAIEDQRRRQREDEDAAFRKETRDRQRTEWTRADQEYADRQAEKQAMRTAGASVEVKPELAPDQQGPQGFVVNGQTFGDPAKARTVADAANAPSARLGRMALASRDPLRGVELQAAASQAELTAMQMQQARAAQEAQEWDRKLYDSLVGSPSKIADPGSITAFMTASAADGMDGSSKWAHKVEGDKLTIYPVGPDGTALNNGFTIPNTLEGRIELASRLSKGTPISAKLADIRAQQKQADDRADKQADNARADRQQSATERYQQGMLDVQRGELALRRDAANRAAAGAGGGQPAPVWDDKADTFLRERYTVKDPTTGTVGVDGNGMQFSKLIGLAQAQRNGGDTTRALGFAFEKDNELRAAATDPKKGYDQAKHNQLRQQYLQALTAPPQPAAAPAAAPPAAAAVPQPRMSQAAGPKATPEEANLDAAKQALQQAQATLMKFGSRQRQQNPEGFAQAKAAVDAATATVRAAQAEYEKSLEGVSIPRMSPQP